MYKRPVTDEERGYSFKTGQIDESYLAAVLVIAAARGRMAPAANANVVAIEQDCLAALDGGTEVNTSEVARGNIGTITAMRHFNLISDRVAFTDLRTTE